MKVEFSLPETSILEKPLNMGGLMTESKKSFYELAKSKIKYLSSEEIVEWHKKNSGRDNYLSNASYIIGVTLKRNADTRVERLINALEIVVNKDFITMNGEDFSDCIPFVIEHEIYEAWLSAKEGAVNSREVNTKHLLAKRREYLIVEQQGLGEKYDRFQRLIKITYLREIKERIPICQG